MIYCFVSTSKLINLIQILPLAICEGLLGNSDRPAFAFIGEDGGTGESRKMNYN